MQFLAQQEQQREEPQIIEGPDLKKEPLTKIAALYFEWKAANNSVSTVAREKRIFKTVEKFFRANTPVKAIMLHQIRQYQKERREQISPTMKQPVTARSVNYEMQLLRAVMSYADCWTDELAARYRPLRQIKRRVGKVASKVQLQTIITTAMGNEFWRVAMYCGTVAAGTGCRSGEIRNLMLGDIDLINGNIRIARELAKNCRISRQRDA